jgi:hypothetical protein
VALWRQLCMEVAPLLYSQALPPPHIGNFLEYQVAASASPPLTVCSAVGKPHATTLLIVGLSSYL